jgi:hypothetical protein
MYLIAFEKSGHRFHAENRAKPPFPNKLKAGGVA